MIKKDIKWIMIFVSLCMVCAGIWFARGADTDALTVAVVKQGNNVIRTIDLSDVTEPYEFEVTEEHGGSNRIRVERGRISVIDADCPDKVCVNRGYIKNSAVPIVCLPHKLSIIITGEKDETDAVAGGR
ncbi:MAG: NusG domain II-containing protein [Candidatus Ornithomonoglobus sp.]